MTRRIVRSLLQLSAALIFVTIVILLLDRNYRVLPDSIHNHLPSHHPDEPGLHRITKELYLHDSWSTKAYMYVRRKREEELTDDDKVVMDLTVGRLNPNDKLEATDSSERWERRPAGIWLKRSSKKYSSDSNHVITAVDVLFGDDAVEVRDGWEIRGLPLRMDQGRQTHITQVTVRRGAPPERKVPKPRVPSNGKFKILQLADLHLSTGIGKCRDAVPDSYNGGKCEADPRTLHFVSKMLHEEKPDFVVLSGDQVNGDTSPDPQSAMFKVLRLLKEHTIPWAAIFGNHDDTQGMTREAQMALMETLPYSMSTAGPADIDGVGNYFVEILAHGSSDHSAITMYFMDTHAYSPDERHYPGYGWIKPNQIEWFKKTARSLKKNHAEYTKGHLDISFIHIPLTEYANYTNGWVGEWREGVTAPVFNTGFRDALVEQGVVMVSAGHDHCNDYCLISPEGKEKKPALWMCYAGGAGFGGYGGYGDYIRRVRVFEIDTNVGRITTWKRVEHGEVNARFDQQIIVDGGEVMPPPPKPQPVPPAVALERPPPSS